MKEKENFYVETETFEKESYYEEDDDFDDDFFNDEDDIASSTAIIPTYDENNQLDYVELMREYHSDNEFKRNKAAEIILADLIGLVRHIIKKKYSSYASKHYEDLLQSGELGVLIGLGNYDPAISRPSTYFYPFIVHELQDYINKHVYKTTPYYSVHIKKINKAIAYLEGLGMPTTARDISIQTNLPLDTVEKTLKIMNNNSEVGLDFCENSIEENEYGNPAVEYAKQEHVEQLYKIVRESLTHEEALIVFYLNGMGGLPKLPLKSIAQRMGISIDRVKKLKTLSYCKLRNSPLSQYRPDIYRNEVLEIEDSDSVVFFPRKQAENSMRDMEEIDIDF